MHSGLAFDAGDVLPLLDWSQAGVNELRPGRLNGIRQRSQAQSYAFLKMEAYRKGYGIGQPRLPIQTMSHSGITGRPHPPPSHCLQPHVGVWAVLLQSDAERRWVRAHSVALESALR